MPNGFIPPIYALAASVDNCNFAVNTTWSQGEPGRTFQYLPGAAPGLQYIHDATDLSSITDNEYDFLVASHVLEHLANPLRALEEFRRVLKPGGAILVLVPNREKIFDHRRPYTSFEHLRQDQLENRDESDLTHLEEIVALHDADMWPVGTLEEFRERCLHNLENRCMHHHVFSLDVLEQAFRATHLRPIYRSDLWGHHLIMFATKA